MNAIANSPSTFPRRQLISIGAAARKYGCHENTLRAACNSGELRCFRLNRTGHQRLLESDILDWLGVESPELDCSIATKKVVIYARVSSNAQSVGFSKGSKDNDLARQVARLSEVSKKDYREPNPKILSDTGSGLSFNRKGFCRLLDDMLAGKLDGSVLLVAYKDRLARFGHEIVERIAKAHQIEIKYVEVEETENQQKELADDLLSVITVFNARAYGARSAKTCREELSAETVQKASELLHSGLQRSQIVTLLNKQGHRTLKGSIISDWVLKKYLSNRLVEQTIQTPKTENSFLKFHKECMKRIPIKLNPRTRKADISCRLLKSDILKAYAKYCKKHKLIRIPDKQIGSIMRELGYDVMLNQKGRTTFVGVALKA